jgi:hypothetical protein
MFGVESGKRIQDISRNCLGKQIGYTGTAKSNIVNYFKQRILHAYISSLILLESQIKPKVCTTLTGHGALIRTL